MCFTIKARKKTESPNEISKAHAKRNKKKFGKALIAFSLKSLAVFKETRSYLFQGGDRIGFTVYTHDSITFKNPNLFQKLNLKIVLLAKMIKLFGILEGFGIVFFLWFPILQQIFKAFEKESESFKIWNGKFASSLAQEVGTAKRFFWNPMSFCKINDLLSQSFKVCVILFRQRITDT